MGNLLAFWEGKKTRILSLLGALVTFAYTMEWVDQKTAGALGGFLVSFGFTTVQHAVTRETAKVGEKVATVQAQVADVHAKVEMVPLVVAQDAANVAAAASPAFSEPPRYPGQR